MGLVAPGSSVAGRSGAVACFRRWGPGLLLCLLGLAVGVGAHEGESSEASPATAAAPGWSESLPFELPEPGSYDLPVLGQAGDGRVVDAGSGEDTTLHRLFDGKFVILSFIYSNCSDVCPLATFVLSKTREQLRAAGHTQDVRFLSLSFDPEHDSPQVMAEYGKQFVDSTSDWRFLTTRNRSQLTPILEAYGQAITPEVDAEGENTDGIAHLLRVYLIDKAKRIRNVYSTAYLHPEALIGDLRTLRLRAGDGTATATAQSNETTPLRPEAGDVKEGYDRTDYRTRSQSLERRQGRHTDLTAYLRSPPLGLPAIPVPDDNPVTAEKVELGRLLFFDRRLSHNNTIACGNCHIPEQGFTSQEIATAVGIEGQTVRRNAPTIYNSAYLTRLFHDGRETSLEHQIWGPLLAGNEMGNPSVGYVLEQVRNNPDYRDRFSNIFDERGVNMETLGMVLAAYQRVLVSGDSPFDRWHYGGEESAMGAKAKRGFRLFTGKAGCSACHTIGDEFALFTDNAMHNTGIGYAHSMGGAVSTRLQVAPGTFIDIAPESAESAAETPPNDLGLYEITEDPDDRWKYRTPTLRNVALTAPYMHNGALGTLQQVVRFYSAGGVPNPLLDPLIRPLNLEDEEIGQLVAFLRSLTGSNVEAIVADAHATPIGNVGQSDD